MKTYGDDYFQFIASNAGADTASLRLKWHGKDPGFDITDALTQIDARRKTRAKLPWFNAHDRFLYPSVQASEQATNQAVALFHARLIRPDSKHPAPHVADLTAGLGIDALTFALNGCKVDAYELDADRAEILRHNAAMLLPDDNLTVHHADSIAALSGTTSHYDVIFIDPARRDSADNRCFLLRDSLPDVITHRNLLLDHADDVYIKASPLLDITQTFREFPIAKVYIVSWRGECKEVLIHIGKDVTDSEITVVDIADSTDHFPLGNPWINYSFSCTLSEMAENTPIYATGEDIRPGAYIYELGAGMRKLDCAALMCRRFEGMKSLARESGLFVSDVEVDGFPGRRGIITVLPDSKALKQLKNSPMRVVCHAYPQTPEQLRARYRFREGDTDTLYATSLASHTHIFILTHTL